MDFRRMKPKIKPKVLPMDARIPKNPKYENIRSQVNTGNNTRKQLEKMEEVGQYYRFRPDEIFRRITVTSLVNLMLEQSKLEIQEKDEHLASQNSNSSPEESSLQTPSTESTQRDAENDKPNSDCNKEEEVDSGVDGEAEIASPTAEANIEDEVLEKNDDNEKKDEPKEDANYELIESVVFKGKMIKRQISIQSHSKSVANLFAGIGSIDDNLSITGSRKCSNSSTGSSGMYSHHHHDSSMAKSTFMIPGAEDEILKPDRMIMLQQEQQALHRSVSEGHLLKTQLSLMEETNDEGEGEKMETTERPYLLLDIRPEEQYESGHIVSAQSYPHVRLARAVNFETREMLALKNREGKLIVVYDYDEGLATKFCTTMMERGYDNVFMLSGGVRVAYIKFPQRLVTKGTIENMEGNEKLSDDDILVIESFQEEALSNTDVRLNHYAPSTLNDQRYLADQPPSICSSRMHKASPSAARDGSMSRGSHLNEGQRQLSEAQKRKEYGREYTQKRRQLPFTAANMKPSIHLASNMYKR